jgi:hypothetical protein
MYLNVHQNVRSPQPVAFMLMDKPKQHTSLQTHRNSIISITLAFPRVDFDEGD